jgi:hypothetical protein
VPTEPVTAERFAEFNEPGFAKIAESTRVDPYGERFSIVTVESRVCLTDVNRRRRQYRYPSPSDSGRGTACGDCSTKTRPTAESLNGFGFHNVGVISAAGVPRSPGGRDARAGLCRELRDQ